MTPTDSAADELQSSINSLKYEVDTLRKKVTLSDLRDQVSDLHNGTLGLPQRIKDLRGRDYDFEKTLESKAEAMAMRWATIRGAVDSQLIQQSTTLQNDMRGIDAQLPQLIANQNNRMVAQPMLAALKTAVDGLDSRVNAAVSAVQNMFDAFEGEYQSLDKHLDEVTWALEQRDEATFRLLPTEGVVMAVKATWAKDGKEDNSDPKGVIFLTDQRLLFEQKQEVATKKILFITTASEMVHKLIFETPVALVEGAVPSKQGMFKNQDFIDLRLGHGAPYPAALFHLDGQDSTGWAALIKRAKEHDLDSDRAVPIDPALVEKVRSAPSKCPSCGGTITQPVMRGQDSITCDFCGAVIRL